MSRIPLTTDELLTFQRNGRETERMYSMIPVNGNDLEGLATELLAARAVLRSVEWAGVAIEDAPGCPACGNARFSGHRRDCRLAAALAGDGASPS